jgi:hypothetical protein
MDSLPLALGSGPESWVAVAATLILGGLILYCIKRQRGRSK